MTGELRVGYALFNGQNFVMPLEVCKSSTGYALKFSIPETENTMISKGSYGIRVRQGIKFDDQWSIYAIGGVGATAIKTHTNIRRR